MTRAPLSRRMVAGAIDAAAMALLAAGLFVGPLVLRGLVVPMWGVLLAVVGYGVTPLAAFKKTLGMKLCGLELARSDGHGVDLGNLVFREFVGRGYFAAGYVVTVLGGLVAQALGVAAFALPVGLGAAMLLASLALGAVAVLGHLVALARPDGRTLADLLAKSYVVFAPALPPPDDAEELAEARAQHRSRAWRVAVFEVALIGLAALLPWVLTSRAPSVTAAKVREEWSARFEKNPADAALAEFRLALLVDPGDGEAAEGLFEVVSRTGPIGAAEEKALRARYQAWKRDAGR